jgi:protein-S-isoprenylcysteine O-methyltransferase Ste14
MRRVFAILGSAIFFIVAPGTVSALLPWWISRWRFQAPLLGFGFLRAVGVLLIIAGGLILLDSFARFAFQGLGTPAPVFPMRHLVVTGLYRHVRNPIYIANVLAIAGQGLLFGDVRLFVYGALVWLFFHLVVPGYEEPTLRATFGLEYEDFSAHVPRWLPHARPWRPAAEH